MESEKKDFHFGNSWQNRRAMRLPTFAVLAFACAPAFSANAQFNGRWDITIHEQAIKEVNEPGTHRPRAWWLKVEGAETDHPRVEFISAFAGDLNKTEEVTINGEELVFGFRPVPRGRGNVPAQPPREPQHLVYKARLAGGKLEGTYEIEGQNQPPIKWTGVRAPVIKDKDDGSWREGKPVTLFNGKDLTGWRGIVSGGEAGWSAENGLLVSNGKGSDLVSVPKFWNYKLHLEYRIPKGSNSGIGLRGRYEVQIVDDFGREPNLHGSGAAYTRIMPTENAYTGPDNWQTYDIRLVGRDITVTLNGKTVVKGELEGPSAITFDPNEAEPGPFILQGDHGRVEFRNMVVTPLVKK
jgi:hypothetical protein